MIKCSLFSFECVSFALSTIDKVFMLFVFISTVLWLLFKVVKDDNEVVLFSYIYFFLSYVAQTSRKLPVLFKNTPLFNSCIQIGIQSNFYSSIKCWSLVQMWSTIHQYFTSTYFYSNIYWETNILTYNLIYKLLLSIKKYCCFTREDKKMQVKIFDMYNHTKLLVLFTYFSFL